MSKLTNGLAFWLSKPAFPLVHDQDGWMTNQELAHDVAAVRGWLAQEGVQPGDRLVLGLPNSYAFVAVYLAALSRGVVIMPVNPDMPGPELLTLIERSRAVGSFLTKDHFHIVSKLRGGPSALRTLFVVDLEPGLSSLAVYRWSAGRWDSRALSESVSPDSTFVPSDEAIGVVMYTSGTTGNPKEVALKHRHLWSTAQNIITSHRLGQADVTYSFLPLFHINAQVVGLLSTLLSGGRIVLARRFSASRFWAAIEEHRVTWVSAVPAVLAILLNTPAPSSMPRHLRFVRSASAPLPAVHQRRFEQQFGVPVIQSYGMTEAASQICVNPLPPHKSRLGSVGIPVGLELRVVDERGRSLAAGDIGEIAIRGDNVVEHVAGGEKDFRDGWFYTGDLGYVDRDGFVFLTGRKKEMINRAGEKISPYEVEDVIRTHAAVREVAVIGLPDPLYGERVAAYIIPSADVTNDRQAAEQIRSHCLSTISVYKCPSEIHFVSSLPTGATGKIQRSALKPPSSRASASVVR